MIVGVAALSLLSGAMYYWWRTSSNEPENNTQTAVATSTHIQTSDTNTATTTQSTDHLGMKLYRNDEFGFEFWYPEGWVLYENTWKSPSSKFNLVVNLPGDDNVVLNSFMINITTPEFADNAIISRERLHAQIGHLVVDDTNGVEYRYSFEGLPEIDVDIPRNQYRVLIVVDKKHEKEFNQILSTFKFLK